jgi:hypothetical protein
MKQKDKRKLWRLIFAVTVIGFVAALSLTGCEDGTPKPSESDPTYGISLNMTGTHVFPAAEPGYGAQLPLTVTVTNTGDQPTGNLTVALSGANSGSFNRSPETVPSISAGGAGSFTVAPNTGLGENTYSATVTVSGGAGITAQSFNVSFTVAEIPVISITGEPIPLTNVTLGSITGSLSVTAEVTLGRQLSYQWYKNSTNSNEGGEAIAGANSRTFPIPTDLSATTHYFFVEVRAEDAVSKRSNVAVVVVGTKKTLNTGSFNVTGNTPTYNGAEQGVTVGFTDTDLNETVVGELTVYYTNAGYLESEQAPTNAGTYDVLAETAGNDEYAPFAKAKVGELTIGKAPITITPDPGHTKVYGDNDPIFAYTITSGEVYAGDNPSGTMTHAGVNVGSHAITQGAFTYGSNYNETFTGGVTIAITARPITIKPNEGQTKIYGNIDPVFAFTITVGEIIGSDSPTGAMAHAGGNVGSYAITQGTFTYGNNYNETFTGGVTIEITQRPITITPTSGLTKVFNTADPPLTHTITVGNVITGDNPTGAMTHAGVNVGNYAITKGSLTYGNNYNETFTDTVTFAITPATGAALTGTLTATNVTENSITVSGVSIAAGTDQTAIEYARGSNNTTPGTWQDSAEFTGLTPNTTYYIFARSEASTNYTAGSASDALTVTTLATTTPNFVYYWFDAHGSLVTSGNTTIARRANLEIKAQEDTGYEVLRWEVNGVIQQGENGTTFIFNRAVSGTYTVGLFVRKDGRQYNTNIEVKVE